MFMKVGLFLGEREMNRNFAYVPWAQLAVLCLAVFASSLRADGQSKYLPTQDKQEIENFAFQRYFTKDKFDRKISFYLSRSKTEKSSKAALPLVVCIQGSGSQSIFQKVQTPRGELIGSSGPGSVIARDFGERVRVLVVEKPGVEFLSQPGRPGGSEDGSPEFLKEFSLERWTEAIVAAVRAGCELPVVDSQQILVLGHSEGGQVACAVAAELDSVSHVAVMAGGGPTQLYDLLVFARSGEMYDPNKSADGRVADLMDDWQAVLEDPLATDKFILGHTHLRWSSFLRSSPIDSILKSNAKVFIAQGTADTNSLPASADVLYTELVARGRDCTYERIDGANHGFMQENDNGAGWGKTNAQAVDWFLKDL